MVIRDAVRMFQVAQETSVCAVPQRMTARFDLVADLDGLTLRGEPAKSGRTTALECPYLLLAGGVCAADVDPGMRVEGVHLRHDTFEIGRLSSIVAMRMVSPRRQDDRKHSEE